MTLYQGNDGEIDLTPKGGIGPYTYLWSNGSEEQDPKMLFKGVYTCVVTDSYAQIAEVTVNINEPGPPVVIVEQKKFEGTIIYFDLNSSYHNAENLKALEDFVRKIKLEPGLKFQVVSHCDRRETDQYNIWLSKRRMEKTIDYLVSKGISKKNITGDYRGEREPDVQCSNCSEDQFSKNRRTVISIVK